MRAKIKIADLAPYTEDQLNFKDRAVLDRFCDSHVSFYRYSKSADELTSTPIAPTGKDDILTNLKETQPFAYDFYKDNAVALLMLWVLSAADEKVKDTRLRAACYLLACNGVRLTFFDDMSDLNSTLMAHPNLENTKLLNAFEISVTNGIVVETVETEKQEAVEKSLVRHLHNCKSMEAVINEICRLQMLSSESLRAESAYEALMTAWKTTQR